MREEFLEWLSDQDEYWIPLNEVKDEFPELEFNFVGITTRRDDDGNTLVPKRDYRQYVKYGQAWD